MGCVVVVVVVYCWACVALLDDDFRFKLHTSPSHVTDDEFSAELDFAAPEAPSADLVPVVSSGLKFKA